MWHITLGSCAWPPPCSSASPDSTAPCYEHTAPAEAAKGACAAASRQRAVSAGTGAVLGAPCLAAPLQLVSGWACCSSKPTWSRREPGRARDVTAQAGPSSVPFCLSTQQRSTGFSRASCLCPSVRTESGEQPLPGKLKPPETSAQDMHAPRLTAGGNLPA